MSSWGKNDNAANAPYWAVNSTIVNAADVKAVAAAPTAANVALLYANTQADAYTTNSTIGLFGVDTNEASTSNRVHSGWVLRTTGSGGRAGRVQEEVLVALSSMGSGSDGDAQTYANVSISLAALDDASVISETNYANTVSFTVTPTLDGNTAATLSYQWQYVPSGGGAWANVPANTVPIHHDGRTGATLYVMPKTTANTGSKYRVIVTATDAGVSATSSNATITIT